MESPLTEKQLAGTRTFDEQPCRGTTLEDLDLDLFRREYLPRVVAPDVIAQNQRTPSDQLASLRFLDPATDLPTNAGVLVLGRDPFKVSHGAYVQFVRFEGVERIPPIRSQQRLTGNLLAQLRDLDRLLELWIQVALVFPPDGGLQHMESPDFPRLALREIIINAMVHRSYEIGHSPVYVYWFKDRIEVASPGGLYGAVTPENFSRRTAYRNPVLAEAAKALGYIERFGMGITQIRNELKKNQNPEPRFEFTPTSVVVTVEPRPDPFPR